MMKLFLSLVIMLVSINAAYANNIFLDDSYNDEQGILEAVYRYQFSNDNLSYLRQRAEIYCLSVNGHSPSDDLLSRFSDISKPVLGIEECPPTEKKPVLIFRIEKIVSKSKKRLYVYGGYYEGFLSSSGERYLVKKKKGKWIVIKSKLMWISMRNNLGIVDSV